MLPRIASLKQVAETTPEAGQRDIEDEWHSSFIRLNEDLGNMEGERAKLARVSQIGVALSRMWPPMRRLLKSLGKAVLTLLVIAVILFVGSHFLFREAGESFPDWAQDRATDVKNHGTSTN